MLLAQRGLMRAEFSVNERDIQDLKEGQTVELATTSKPTSKYAGRVERIIPLGQAKEGSNVFTVYVQLQETSPGWRPGMAGEGKIDVDRRTWAWIWTHRLIDFLRLKMWM
jgi:hypothetical protein